MTKFTKKAGLILLTILCTVCLACGLSACKPKKTPIGTPENVTTYRLKTPNDGSLPTAHTPLENIGYMAYTLDNQSYYHTYAYNSSKAMGYDQVTQSWKDHKGEKESGYVGGATISSDLSYSSLVKSATQSCFIGKNDGYMRGGSKPGKNTTAITENWDITPPAYYDREAFLYKYGEFPNEISVYVINEDTINRADEVVDNGDGTYTQKYYLNKEAACWYQYGLKTRGGLKGYPKYNSLTISFTFDAQWQILSSYCEEKTKIAPSAMGGIDTDTTSKTTVTYSYGAEAIDEEHYAYIEDYFKAHLDNKVISGGDKTPGENDDVDLMTVLANGFSKVVAPDGSGQQFNLKLNLGSNEYTGKLFASLTNMSDILGSLDVRASLGKGGKQDLYIGFANGDVNAYYSDTFAATANVGSFGTVISQFSDWAKRFEKPAAVSAAYALADDGEEDDGPLADLIASLKLTATDTTAKISLVTDDLLGTGIGADVALNFSRKKLDGGDEFAFTSATLGGITYSKNGISLSAEITPDNSGAAVITHEKSQTPADIKDYINNVYNLLNSNAISVSLGIDGTKEGVISMLSGVVIDATSHVVLGSDMAAQVDLSLAIGGNSAKLSAYYNVNIHSGDYGTVYLTLKEVNGKELNARVRSNINSTIDAVNGLISVINNNGAESGNAGASLTAAPVDGGSKAADIAQIINNILNLNFSEVFGEIYASNSEIRLGVSVDKILGGLGVNFADIKFGTAALALGKDAQDRATLSLELANLGFTISVRGSEETPAVPDASDYTDVNDLIALVKSAAVKVNEIIAAQDIAFDIDSRVTVDGITLAVKGKGEAVWGEKTRVALDVVMYVADGTRVNAKDTVTVKFVYDEAASDGTETAEEPVALLAVNDLGLKIYRSDIDGLVDGFNTIMDALAPIIVGEKNTETTPAAAVQLYKSAVKATAASDITDAIEGILGSSNVQTILKAVLGFIGDLTVDLTYSETDSTALQSLLITHAVNGSLAVGLDDNLWLNFTAYTKDTTNPDNKIEVAYVNASVTAGNGGLSVVDWTYDDAAIVFNSTDTATDAFVKIAYNYLFAVIEDLTVQHVLGTDTYTVDLELTGEESSIPALEDITVKANLYYTHGIKDGVATNNKLVEVALDLDIKGVPVQLNVRYADEYAYVELNKLATVTLTNIKVRAGVYDIYSVAEQIVDLITNTDLLTLVTGKSGGTEAAAVRSAVASVKGATKVSLTNVISSLITLDFTKAINASKVDGVNTLTVNPDYVIEKMGLNVPEIGTVTVGVNPKTHTIDATVKTESATKAWITLSAYAADRREELYAEGWKDAYTDISFVSQLVSDITKTAFTDNKLNTLYTLTGGSLTVDIKYSVITASISITDINLTAGLDDNGQFYFALNANLQASNGKLTFIPIITVAEASPISITYSNKKIIMGRTINSKQAYKVMTLEYLLDNLMDKNNSPLCWLLQTDSTAWGLIADNVKLNIQTGLTKPKSYYLYDQLAQAEKDKTGVHIDLAKYVREIAVNSGSYNASFKAPNTDTNVVSALGLTNEDNYYAFDINPELIGTVSKLQAAIFRDNTNGGITGLKLATGIGSEVSVAVNFNGLTADKDSAVPDNYNTIVNETYNIDFDHVFTDTAEHREPIFGCFTWENDTESYACSMKLAPHTLTVMDGGEVSYTLEDIGYSSTVYLTNVFQPNWVEGSNNKIYGFADENGNVLDSFITIEGDTVIYVAEVDVLPVKFHIDRNGIGTFNGALAIGQSLPEYPSQFGNMVFMGWYTDTDYTTKVETYVAGITDVYANYVVSTHIADNGVIYTLGANGEFTVTGYDENKIAAYTADDSWLILENEIDGYPVTSIAATAFAKAGIKNVVVPENVTYVGSLAFLDNVDMRTAVFLAETVTFGGQRGTSSSGGYPFFGCTATGNDKTTNLSVYYNTIVSESEEGKVDDTAPYWSQVRGYTEGLLGSSKKYRYIGHNGGDLGSTLSGKDRYEYSISDGNRVLTGGVADGNGWSYVKLEVVCNDFNKTINAEEVKLTGINTGLTTVAVPVDDVVAQAIQSLNGITSVNGYINAFEVEASCTNELQCGIAILTVTITEKPQNEWWYAVNVEESTATGIGAHFESENIDGIFVKAGDTVAITPKQSSHEFSNAPVCSGVNFTAANNGYMFIMPEGGITIEVALQEITVNEVTLHSAVNFTYGSAEVTGSEASGYTAIISGVDASTTLVNAASSEYTFIGWAYVSGSVLEFANPSEVKYPDYYAIWAVSRDGVTYGYEAGANLPTVTPADNFVGWYNADDTTFDTKLDALSTANTVLRTRMKFIMTVTASTGNTETRYECNENTDQVLKAPSCSNSWGSLSYTGTSVSGGRMPIDVIEGNTVTVSRYWSDGFIIRITGDTSTDTYVFFGFKTNGTSDKGSKRKQFYDASHYLELGGNWTIANGISNVSGSSRYYAGYSSDNNDQLFATATISGNITVHSQM